MTWRALQCSLDCVFLRANKSAHCIPSARRQRRVDNNPIGRRAVQQRAHLADSFNFRQRRHTATPIPTERLNYCAPNCLNCIHGPTQTVSGMAPGQCRKPSQVIVSNVHALSCHSNPYRAPAAVAHFCPVLATDQAVSGDIAMCAFCANLRPLARADVMRGFESCIARASLSHRKPHWLP